jgi:uncharacterized membrane protein YjgN (DUF898 family)
LAWVIVVLLGLILIVLVFNVGILVGNLKSPLSSYKTDNHHMGKEFSNLMYQKKAKIEAFKAKAESMGMTAEDFKKYLIEQKKAELETKAESDK